MRAHTEIDPVIGLKGFHAIQQLKRDYSWAIDIEICIFPQEGMLNNPGTEELMGADVIGGCPYTDSDPHGQITRIFELAQRFDLDIDFHLDFDLDPTTMAITEVIRQTESFAYHGRVAAGHVTKLSALQPDELTKIGKRLAETGIAITARPSTDLFLTGREYKALQPRGIAPVHTLRDLGVLCSLATNNVLNPFTPFGDCSLPRIANIYANAAQLGSLAGIAACHAMISGDAARLMRLKTNGLTIGSPADCVVVDAPRLADLITELTPITAGYKAGRRTFLRPAPVLNRP